MFVLWLMNLVYLIFICLDWYLDLWIESYLALLWIEFISLIYGIKWLIVSELFLFLSCFSSLINFWLSVLCFFYFLLFSSLCFSIPFSELIILVWSSLNLNSVFIFIRIGFGSSVCRSIIKVSGFGFSFIFLQSFEFYYLLVSVSDYFLDCIFYFTTSLHGFHVIVGFLGLFIYVGIFNLLLIDCNLGFFLLSLYWHFVDFIWLIVFLLFFC